MGPAAEVYVFHVQEEALVEGADGLQQAPGEEHAGP